MRRGALKIIRQRANQDLSDLAVNTRKRRRLARRLIKEQPLFAYDWLSQFMDNYSMLTFIRDTQPTPGKRKKGTLPSARMEMHRELIRKLDMNNPNNKIVQKIMMNWENIKKPFTFSRFGCNYRFPKKWALATVRRISLEMMQLNSREETDSYWDKINSYGS